MRIRHVHAGPNEWIKVHRNGGGGSSGGGGGGGGGCLILIAALLALAFWKQILALTLLAFGVWAAYKVTGLLVKEAGWGAAGIFWGCIGVVACLVAWPLVTGSILAACAWLALSVWIASEKGWKPCVWMQIAILTTISLFCYPIHTLLFGSVITGIYFGRGRLRRFACKHVRRLRLHLERNASSTQSIP